MNAQAIRTTGSEPSFFSAPALLAAARNIPRPMPPAAEAPVRVLLVDDDEEDLFLTESLLRDIPDRYYQVDTISDAGEAKERMIAAGSPDGATWDVCLIDYRLGYENGLELLRHARAAGFRAPVILLTGLSDHHVDQAAAAAGASDYLVKGNITPADLERTIRFAIAQKQTEARLREQSAFVSAILDTATALVIVLDRDEHIVRFNRACEMAFGYSFEDVEGHSPVDRLLPAEYADIFHARFQYLLENGGPSERESVWLTRAGELRRIAWANTVIRDERGQIEYIVGTGIDVTERRETEAALAEARAREVEIGALIQQALLVREPPTGLPGIKFATYSRPSQSIDGDFIDFYVLERDIVDMMTGDVMGKGVPAALLAAATKNQLHRATRRLQSASARFGRHPQPEEVVAALHHQLSPELWTLRSFVTLAYVRFDLAKGRMSFVDCGSTRPIHYHAATGTCTTLNGDGLPLGIRIHEEYRTVEFSISPGDLFLFYSDGVTETTDPETDDLYGEERVAAVVERAGREGCTATELVERVRAAVDDFGGGVPHDDLTCVAVQIENWTAPMRLAYAAREFLSDTDDLLALRLWAADFLRTNTSPTLSETEIALIEAALAEAAGNIVKHAYRGEGGLPIQMEMEAFDGEIRIILRDRGLVTLDLSNLSEPSFDGSRESGFGWYIIRQCFDEYVYRRDELGRNCLILYRRSGVGEGG